MKTAILALALLPFALPALADTATPPPFASIDQATFAEWVERIKKAPWEQANPVLMVLDRMEADAQAKAAKAKEAPKPVPKP